MRSKFGLGCHDVGARLGEADPFFQYDGVFVLGRK